VEQVNGRIRSRRLAAALLATAAVAGAALGLAFTRGEAKGSLSHGPAGHVTLRFSRSFNTQRAPELYVHMDSRRMPLQRAWGAQSYSLAHAGARDLDATVQVFCEKCNKAWGVAKLAPVSPNRGV
jgi:hypothetical protein